MSEILNTANYNINCSSSNNATPVLSRNKIVPSFKGEYADMFIKDNYKQMSQPSKQNFMQKYFTMPTATMPFSAIAMAVALKEMSNIKKASKGNLSVLEKDIIKKKACKKLLVAALIALAGMFSVSSYFNSKNDENKKETRILFDKLNDTSAKLSDNNFSSSSILAQYDFISGEVAVSNNSCNDPLQRIKLKHLLKHELVHAKQAETIARMDNGIELLNYASMKQIANSYKNNIISKNLIENIYKELVSEPPEKYANTEIYLSNKKVPFREFIFTIHKLMNNQEKGYNDIPLFINKEHYEAVREKLGKLTAEENEKGKIYYDALINYKYPSFFQILNPKSDYYQNPLEKEAFAVMPAWARYL